MIELEVDKDAKAPQPPPSTDQMDNATLLSYLQMQESYIATLVRDVQKLRDEVAGNP